ncbi:MAG: ABC transporter ATP-binding protein [Bdellovibrionales bacterium]|nr:ABC transporter ATP-binding protein [Bdellovibrionales bacterium]
MSHYPLELKDLSIGYRKPLCQNINLTLKEGKFVTIMGENGCGKTTLIDTIMGLKKLKSGSITFWGSPHDSPHNQKYDKKIAWVISQQEKYSALLRIKDLLKTMSMAHENWDDDLCAELLEKFELDPKKRLKTLSLGEHSKVRLLKALASQPKLLILDELTANLSPKSKKVLTECIINLFVKNKMAVLYVSHFEDEALRLSDEVYELSATGLTQKGGKSA